MKPARIHYFIAQQWPTKIWLTAIPSAFVVGAAYSSWEFLVSPIGWTDRLLFLGFSLVVAILGYLIGFVVGWPLLGPMYYDRSLKNGEPFHEGDMVQILVGPYRDCIVRVIEAFDYAAYTGAHRVRVGLGTDAEDGEDVFRSIEILRVSSSTQGKQYREQPNKAIDGD